MVLVDHQLDQLRERGWTTVPDVVSDADLAAMRDMVWTYFEQRGLDRDDSTTWPDRLSKLKPLSKMGAFDAFVGDAVESIGDQLIGAGQWTTLGVRPQALVNMPSAEPWSLPHKIWHFDLPGRGPTHAWGAVRFFGLIDDVGPREGGTLIVEGSHELVRRMVAAAPNRNAGSSSEVRKQLRESPFFRRLSQPEPDPEEFMAAGAEIDGVRVRVAELIGRAGDLIVMHPWILHNISINAGDRPRVAMSYSLYTTTMSFYGDGESA